MICVNIWFGVLRLTSANHFYFDFTIPQVLLFPHLWAIFRYPMYSRFYVVWFIFGNAFLECETQPFINQLILPVRFLCGINFLVDKPQTVLLSVTNVACHKIVIWFHLLLIFWALRFIVKKINAFDLILYISTLKNNISPRRSFGDVDVNHSTSIIFKTQ